MEYKHENVIGLMGYCDEKYEKIIVYEYAPRGSLDRYLNDASLTWVKRLNICIDVASALDFLHGGVGKQAKVIHRDIKTANILLNQDWKAKLGDFGLSLISPLIQETDYVVDHACGTPGYLDPLYRKSGFLTIESDIYSFGVVFFEILCGRSTFAIQKQDCHYLADFIKKKFEEGKHNEVVFEQIREEIIPKSLTRFQEIAYQCLHHEREKRPATKKVLMQLKKAFEFQGKYFGYLKVPLDDIKSATHKFSDTYKFDSYDDVSWYRVELGHFYKRNHSLIKGKNEGEHSNSKGHDIVVIKRYPSGRQIYREELFFREVEILSIVNHPNVVTFFGFCVEGFEKILVTENVSNGYLGSYLQKVKDIRILTWEKRLKICIDVAHALNYLHYEMEDQAILISRDISSYGIGLDEQWGAKIMDFGSSVLLPPYQEDDTLFVTWKGKPSYIDPEHKMTSKLKRESDVYSFGVVMFELLCGRIAYDPIYKKGSDKGLAYVARKHYCMGTLEEMIIDPLIKEETNIY